MITPEAPGGGLNHLSKALAELLKCTNLDWKAFTCKPGEEQYRWATGMKIRGPGPGAARGTLIITSVMNKSVQGGHLRILQTLRKKGRKDTRD